MTIDSCRIKILEELKDTEQTYVSQLRLVYEVNIIFQCLFIFLFFFSNDLFIFFFISEYCKESC